MPDTFENIYFNTLNDPLDPRKGTSIISVTGFPLLLGISGSLNLGTANKTQDYPNTIIGNNNLISGRPTTSARSRLNTILNGQFNKIIGASSSAILGGAGNNISGNVNLIAMGNTNTIETKSFINNFLIGQGMSTILNGVYNKIDQGPGPLSIPKVDFQPSSFGVRTLNFSSPISSIGESNQILNGQYNYIRGANFSNILNGYQNVVLTSNSGLNSISNGLYNTIYKSSLSTIENGSNNTVWTADKSNIHGGTSNQILNSNNSSIGISSSGYLSNSSFSNIYGGALNTISSSKYSNTLNGEQNAISTSNYSTIINGGGKRKLEDSILIVDSDYAPAAGYYRIYSPTINQDPYKKVWRKISSINSNFYSQTYQNNIRIYFDVAMDKWVFKNFDTNAIIFESMETDAYYKNLQNYPIENWNTPLNVEIIDFSEQYYMISMNLYSSSFLINEDKNQIDQSNYSIINGGYTNTISTSRNSSILSVGYFNNISNSPNASIIGGIRSNIVNHSGAMILSDGQERDHYSSGINSLTLDFNSGIYFAQPNIYGNLTFKSPITASGIFAYGGNVLRLTNSIPQKSSSPGETGQYAIDSNYLYIRINNKWKRTALAEF